MSISPPKTARRFLTKKGNHMAGASDFRWSKSNNRRPPGPRHKKLRRAVLTGATGGCRGFGRSARKSKRLPPQPEVPAHLRWLRGLLMPGALRPRVIKSDYGGSHDIRSEKDSNGTRRIRQAASSFRPQAT